MTDNSSKETKDTGLSTDTLFVLLLVICGIAAIILVAYLLYKPAEPSNEVVIRDIIVSEAMVEESDNIESVEESLENSYLAADMESEDAALGEAEPVEAEEEIKVVEDKQPIFRSQNTLKKTTTSTSLIKASPVVNPSAKEHKLVTIKAYWIQVGSFSTSAQAAKSVELLKEKGLSSRVVLKNVDGQSVYRVRIGAYESREEAYKFCDEVKKIEGYEDSYVSESTTQKYIEI